MDEDLNAVAEVINAQQRFDPEVSVIERVKQGDRQAFHQLYQSHSGMVYRLCLRLMADSAMAEDATQEVFIQLWQKIHNFTGQSKFSTWLHSVTSNIAITYLRRQRGWLQRVFSIEQVAVNEPATEDNHHDELDVLIARLPERARIVFVLYAVEGYRHEEIADMTGMAVGSSKAQLHRAKQLLKAWIDYE